MNKKQKRKIKKLFAALCASGIALFAIQIIYNNYATAPVAWMKIVDGEKIYFKENEDTGFANIKNRNNEINTESVHIDLLEKRYYIEYMHEASMLYPNRISLEYSDNIENIFKNSFIMNLNIANKSENELMLNDLKFVLKQNDVKFPILGVKSYIEDNEFKIDINNLTDKRVSDLTVRLNDYDDKLKDI